MTWQHSTLIQHYAQCYRPSQCPRRGHPFRVPTAPPLALAAPAPRPRATAAQQRAGRFRSVAPCAPCRGHPVAHRHTPVPSLHDPRHRSCTGSRLLAALAPSCRRWRRTPQTAAVRLRTPAAAWGYGPEPEAAAVRGLILRITLLNYAQRNFAHNSCYTHNRPRRVAAAAGQGLRTAAVKQRSGPQRSGPQQRHGAAAARAGLVAVVGGISARSCCTLRSSTGRAKQGGPPARAPAPAHPARRRRGLGRVGLRRPGPASRRSPARAIKPA